MNTRTSPLRLKGELTIYEAQELRKTLLTALAGVDALEVELLDVTQVDTAGMQVLMAAKQVALRSHKALSLVHHSAAVLEVMELLSLAAYFGDPIMVPKAG